MNGAVLMIAAAVAAGTATSSWIATGVVLRWLRRRAIVAVPNGRSSHVTPTPCGGGLAVVAVVLAAWAVTAWAVAAPLGITLGTVVAGAVLLYGVSWADDLHDIPRRYRFPVHVAAVGAVLIVLPESVRVFADSVPLWAERGIVGLAWLWFLNLYNFMDGIDGITGVQSASLGAGVIVSAGLAGAGTLLPLSVMGAAVLGAAVGFLAYNWQPARLFLGDVGAVPLGYLLGFALFVLAAEGAVAAALILPAYYLADASLTLVRRVAAGQRPWAHRDHYYQRAVHRGGMRHAEVAAWVLAGNMGLIGAAAAALGGHAAAGAGLAGLIVCGLLIRFSRCRCRSAPPDPASIS